MLKADTSLPANNSITRKQGMSCPLLMSCLLFHAFSPLVRHLPFPTPFLLFYALPPFPLFYALSPFPSSTLCPLLHSRNRRPL